MNAHLEQFRAFAAYNRDFNRALYERLEGLSDQQRKAERGAFFGSIHATLNHILLADRIWLARIYSVCPECDALASAELVTQFETLGDELYADFAELTAARARTDRVIVEWVAQLNETLLARVMRYKAGQGQERVHPLWLAMAHLFNHQTHHRGQVTSLMSQLGQDPGITDFLIYAL